VLRCLGGGEAVGLRHCLDEKSVERSVQKVSGSSHIPEKCGWAESGNQCRTGVFILDRG
jgi:hypothetical protein